MLALLAIARYALCADTEIVGAQWDTEGLANLARAGYWGDMGSLYRPPVVPIVAHWFAALAIPYRMGLEAALIGAAAFLALQVRPRFNAWVSLAVFAALLFNPYAIRAFTEFQREPFLYVEYIVLLGCALIVLDEAEAIRKRAIASAFFGLFCAAIVLTREGEEVFIVVFVASLCLFSLFRRDDRRDWVRKAGLLVAPAALITVTLCSLTAVAHNANWGVPAYRGLFPYIRDFLTEIHQIKVDDSVRYAPATRKSFAEAARVSKTFAEFVGPALASDEEAPPMIKIPREHSSGFVHRLEIDPSRTLWLVNNLVVAQYGANPKVLVEKLQAATAEVHAALASGALPRTDLRLPYPFDPNLSAWLPALPAELGQVLHMLVAPSADEAGVRKLDDFRPDLFDAALTRRGALVARQFRGPQDAIREAVAGNYRFGIAALAALCFVIGVFGAISGRLWPLTLALFSLIGARLVIYGVMLVSVAPVDRYVVFMSPLTGALICLLCAFAGSGVRSVLTRGRTGRPEDAGAIARA
ncbi:hypothetical protein CCR94_21020 [Rhodoblastus sphagnicola]|uniref:Glycosyltransferase RgtA/B/C/D-like domain-containing protein n=1 Tax=Rhodoblastus sphagnicola TaxID=333368 RepID=A0A2S6MX31_9HYPH|nr:hypothetical protein CCR94_21020 [Rhodoblastus sphagnicola]